MSLLTGNDGLIKSGFPRVSGDEPAAASAIASCGVFSPRERG